MLPTYSSNSDAGVAIAAMLAGTVGWEAKKQKCEGDL
jgi:hypothetical protein